MRIREQVMINVSFYNENEIQDELLKFAVIAARYQEKWIFCRHKERVTWEIPGGHREVGEDILDTARRELYEETGAIYFQARL
jgi:8-oxo-dGTP diphosphatase